jgi:beta-lactamase superfamily II metal-dependent hydrolase
MSTVHFLNVGKGDCTLIEHNSGRDTLIDICKGNLSLNKEQQFEAKVAQAAEKVLGNFGMSKVPTNPVSYLKDIGVTGLFRFILTHPDMDHLDGLDNLFQTFSVGNFWHTGVTREVPTFETGEYRKEDWDIYEETVAGKRSGLKVLSNLAASKFKFANEGDTDGSSGDGLSILAPNAELVKAAIESGDVNDSSYVLLYRSAGGRILIPGDAHDETWDYVLEHYKNAVSGCSVLFAPHHGRRSGRSFEFLDIVKPKMTFFGCASSGHLAYKEWSKRGLPVVTNNQAGNIVLECADGQIDIYVENSKFAESAGCDLAIVNDLDYTFYQTIPNA